MLKVFISDLLKEIVNSKDSHDIRKLFDDTLSEMEAIIDREGLRGKPASILKSAKKKLLNDLDMKNRADIINLCYKSQAKSKLSREAKTIFIT
ncbi:hypothetical protein MTBBW1_950004 [Desulfamplus magnetovallimortis]|uniref:Uncharacterized protein n=1 Tax=Desulfamplus magnetovallimortis TaxID=1246637 RepID=A0A1W1HL93_9BACT|nr:hypothetical protein [Desulfamplus magnetovallimortis]SLM33206.1 hypothetical protein MTBBW1_950004 [Desulfamplus magnetovallimortis]